MFLIVGGDGFCGWPTTLHLLNKGYDCIILDNLSRRSIDGDLGTTSVIEISTIDERVAVANEEFSGQLLYEYGDVTDFEFVVGLFSRYEINGVVHFGEQRSAPYSMKGSPESRYTLQNNLLGSQNLCEVIARHHPNIPIVHLGTMGVYGYDDSFGEIPEGYIEVSRTSSGKPLPHLSPRLITYPYNPGSIYHLTKCLDNQLFQFYSKNWGLKITDLHQGIVWGIETPETIRHKALTNRFDYDGIYGTVLNRFLMQAAFDLPLTIYGKGGQERAFIHISDTAKCVLLALENSGQAGHVTVFNQVSEVHSVKDLAEKVAGLTDSKIAYIENPRKEMAENRLMVSNRNFCDLGFEPIKLDDSLMADVVKLAESSTVGFDSDKILNSPKW